MADYRLQFLLRASNQASQVFSQANGDLANLGKQAQRIGRDITLGLTTPILGIGTAAVKAASGLDTQMKNIQSVSKQTNPEIDALARSFLEMSTDMTRTTDSAEGLASAFYNIQGSGFAGADAMKVLEASTMAASAGLTKTETASEAVTAKLNAYGESAEEAAETSDMMFRTVDIGVGTFSELANSLGYVVGVGAQAGVTFDEISAALATMSKQGIDFQMGARALNMLILAMIDPSDEMADALARIGFESGQTALDTLGLAGVLRQLELAGYAGTEGMASLGLSTYSLRAALALTGEGAETFQSDLEAMGDASGAAKEAFDIQVESFESQVRNLQNTLNSVLIPAGTTLIREVLIPMAEELTPLIRSVGDLDPQTMKWGLRLAGVLALVGPGIITLGSLAGVLGTLKIALFGAAAGAVAKTGALKGQVGAELTSIALAGRLTTAFGGLAGAAAGVGLVLGMVTSAFELQRRLFGGAEEDAAQASASYEEYAERMGHVYEWMRSVSHLHPALRAGFEALDAAQRAGLITLEKSSEDWFFYVRGIEDAAEANARLAEWVVRSGEAMDFFTGGPLGDFREGIGELAEDAEATIRAFDGMGDAALRMAEAVDAATRAKPDYACLLYTSPSPRDATLSRMPSSA